jgi:hypothetical protein
MYFWFERSRGKKSKGGNSTKSRIQRSSRIRPKYFHTCCVIRTSLVPFAKSLKCQLTEPSDGSPVHQRLSRFASLYLRLLQPLAHPSKLCYSTRRARGVGGRSTYYAAMPVRFIHENDVECENMPSTQELKLLQ